MSFSYLCSLSSGDARVHVCLIDGIAKNCGLAWLVLDSCRKAAIQHPGSSSPVTLFDVPLEGCAHVDELLVGSS